MTLQTRAPLQPRLRQLIAAQRILKVEVAAMFPAFGWHLKQHLELQASFHQAQQTVAQAGDVAWFLYFPES